MNLQQLYYFQKVAECQQYTSASRELHITQAALSYSISHLEKELDCRLLERHGKYVSLTEAGEIYLASVREALHALDDGAEQIRKLQEGFKTTISIGYLESLSHLVLSLVSEQETRYPDQLLRFHLFHTNAETIERQLIHREVDLGVSTFPGEPDLGSHLLGYQDNVIIVSASHPWAERTEVSLSELSHQRFIAYTRSCMIRSYYDQVLQDLGVFPEIFAESQYHSNILDMVSFDMGISLVPRMKSLETRRDIRSLNIVNDIPPRSIYLVWNRKAEISAQCRRIRDRIIETPDIQKYLS